jgi:hypothetical protein
MKLDRRHFLKAAGALSIGAHGVWAQSARTSDRNTESISTIRVAQVKVYPLKGEMDANHQRLMDILKDLEAGRKVDVVVTPEGFLDGYVSTEETVTKENMIRYAI